MARVSFRRIIHSSEAKVAATAAVVIFPILGLMALNGMMGTALRDALGGDRALAMR
jgi:hypothetical protein